MVRFLEKTRTHVQLYDPNLAEEGKQIVSHNSCRGKFYHHWKRLSLGFVVFFFPCFCSISVSDQINKWISDQIAGWNNVADAVYWFFLKKNFFLSYILKEHIKNRVFSQKVKQMEADRADVWNVSTCQKEAGPFLFLSLPFCFHRP